MYELIQVAEKTYYIDCPAKIGIYKSGENEIWLIDSGNDKDTGRKVLRIAEEQGWKIAGIVNTHCHADHTGGNNIIQQRTGCGVVSTSIESAVAANTLLKPTMLYGAFPPKKLRGKHFLAQPSVITGSEQDLPAGLEAVRLGGHSMDMIGIRTSDDVFFLGDSLLSAETLQKYHIAFLYDVKAFLQTMDELEKAQAKLFIPSHAAPSEDIRELIAANRQKMLEIIEILCEICTVGKTPEDILAEVFDRYGLRMDFNQYILVGSTLRSYLAYLYDEERIEPIFEKNHLIWRTKQV